MIKKIKTVVPVVLFVSLILGGLIAPFYMNYELAAGIPMNTLYIPLL